MNVMNLYLQACRYLLEADFQDAGIWIEIQKHLSNVRQALTCCVCGGLLSRPMGPSESVCHHYVCRNCMGGKMRFIKRGCGWCKDSEEFVQNGQIESIVRCFQQLCHYLRGKGSRIFSGPTANAEINSIVTIINEATANRDSGKCDMYASAEKSTVYPPSVSPTSKKQASRQSRKKTKRRRIEDDQSSDKEISFKNYKQSKFSPLHHGVGFSSSDQFQSCTFADKRCTPICSVAEMNPSVEEKLFSSRQHMLDSASAEHDSPCDLNAVDFSCDTDRKMDFVLAEHDYNKYTADVTDSNAGHSSWTSEDQSPKRQQTHIREPTDSVLSRSSRFASSRDHVTDQSRSTRTEANAVTNGNGTDSNRSDATDSSGLRCKTKGKFGCRCALAAPNPGKLTCCGQRCPCYAAFRGCDNCKCRGCRNTRGDTKGLSATLLRSGSTSQALASSSHTSLNKLSTTVT